MNVNDVYKIVQYILNKSQMGELTPDEFNTIAPQAERQYLSFLLGNVEGYQYGRQIARVELGMNQPLLQKLKKFLTEPIPLTITSGVADFPPDFEAGVAMYTSTMGKIRFVQQDALYQWLDSVIDPIATNPIYLYQRNGFRFYPDTLQSALISYIATPTWMKWGFTLDGNGLPQYDENTSDQPLWYEIDMVQIIVRILKMAGVNLKDGDVVQYANQIQLQGA